MAIRIGKTIDLPTLNAMTKTETAFRELGEMFAGERGKLATEAADAINRAMVAFEMCEPKEETEAVK